MSPNHAGLLIFGLIFLACILIIWRDERSKKNRRVRPRVHKIGKPVPDSRDWQKAFNRWTRS
jgi:hypothetical protein